MTLLCALHKVFRNILQKTGNPVAGGRSIDHTAVGVQKIQLFLGTGNRHIAQPALLLHLIRLIDGLHARKEAVFKPGQKYHRKFQPLGCMHRHHNHAVRRGIVIVHIGHQGSLFEKTGQIREIAVAVFFVILNGGSQFIQIIHPGGFRLSGGLPHGKIPGILQHGGI